MRRTIITLCIPMASAAILVGCGAGQPDKSEATRNQSQAQHLTLTGCIETGIGTNEYRLTGVNVGRGDESTTGAASSNPITPDSQVRLAFNDEHQLRNLTGHKVRVTGTLKDDGRNTIGTSGSTAARQPDIRTDQSQAATDQHHSSKVAKEAGPIGQRSMNNGTFPELTVIKVDPTGEKCPNATER